MPSVFETQEAQGLGAGGSSRLQSGTPGPLADLSGLGKAVMGSRRPFPRQPLSQSRDHEPGIHCGQQTEKGATGAQKPAVARLFMMGVDLPWKAVQEGGTHCPVFLYKNGNALDV